MRALQLCRRGCSLNHTSSPLVYYYGSIHQFSDTALPDYAKPLPLDVKTGKLKREFSKKPQSETSKINHRFRKYVTFYRRRMDRELVFGYAACRMMNKLSKGGNQKMLQQELVNHLYALKLNSFRMPFMELESDRVEDDLEKRKPIKLTRRLRQGSSWNKKQKKRKTVTWEDRLKQTTKNSRIK
eukprot:CAMPEP_0202694464 /NCGR_PEP_ID=MMETSP1385-20130828/8325_1 /ASSEMBLY_ACC=CAM_ASM_000861 /TAXON_ID=933848 /ORGANISM="Elphidium margaritaceum" /LENGTH=183 /DNA_ID=CAMNT_0049350317 /DNA_START=12 /DNA_END=563 /DNA_ORIENTATION=-